jgi:hypothetical protein
MRMKLTITLQNDQNENKILQWTLKDSSIACRWAKLVKSTPRQNENYHSGFDWWMAGYTQEHFDKIVASMATICARLNSEKGFDIPPEWFNNVNRESLNRLHLKFHELAENIANDPAINQLNYIVHNAESCLLNIHWKQKFSNLILNLNVFAQEPLTADDYLEFTEYSVAPGTLMLSYDTIGKNLYHCYKDNDIDLIRGGMVRPKLNLTSAIGCYIGGSIDLREPARYHKWCDDNDILGNYGYDSRSPLHSGGCCVIGESQDWDADGLTEWLLDSSGVHVHHWILED